ncbi:recombinase family protein [Aureimonas leprariae]|uniref:Recombinase family protein n=1 Tax=Plantimonas leprariae TaxID=2615207 RepID=A0A7V7TVJ0_9HYPH|nr:recombinase family protein [Aureimonas leprariae]KAB0678057.1 recombinase family protein [Aureimonas leprariae]
MLIGYARTSTLEQEAGLEAQIRDLSALGCEQIFSEQVSSIARREQLEAALTFARKGDTLVVTKLDRLARSVLHMAEIAGRLDAKGVALRVISMGGGEGGLDTSTATGRLMLNVVMSVAQFEREMMLERQREGIAKAKSLGRYTGRKPTAMAQAEKVKALAAKGLSMGQIAAEVGIGKGSVHRILTGKPKALAAVESAAA